MLWSLGIGFLLGALIGVMIGAPIFAGGLVGLMLGWVVGITIEMVTLKSKLARVTAQLDALIKTYQELKAAKASEELRPQTQAQAPPAPIHYPETPLQPNVTAPIVPPITPAIQTTTTVINETIVQASDLEQSNIPDSAVVAASISAQPVSISNTAPSNTAPAFARPTVNEPIPNTSSPHQTAATKPVKEKSALWQLLFGGNLFVRLGILLVFLGIVFLLRYSIQHDLVPIQARLAGVALGALGLLAAGWKFRHRSGSYGLILQAGGIGLLYLTVFGAFSLYQIIPALPAFALLLLLVIAAVALAVLQNSLPLAVFATIGGFLAPLLTSTGSNNYIGLFSFYALLNAGIVAVAWFKAWRLLNLIGLVFTFGIATTWGWLSYQAENFATTEPFLILFFIFYVVIGVLFATRTPDGFKDKVDGSLIFGTPLIGFGLQVALVKQFDYGIAISSVVLGVFYIVLSRVLWRKFGKAQELLAQAFLSLGVIFTTLAIPFAVEGSLTGAAWALEGCGILWISIRQHHFWRRLFAVVLQVAALVAVLIQMADINSTATLGEFIALVLVSGALLLSSYLLAKSFAGKHETEAWISLGLLALGIGVLGLAFERQFPYQGAVMVLVWSLGGVVAVALGSQYQRLGVTRVGLSFQYTAALLMLLLMLGSRTANTAFLNMDFAVALVIATGLLVSAVMLSRRQQAALFSSALSPLLAVAFGLQLVFFELQLLLPPFYDVLIAHLIYVALVSVIVLAASRVIKGTLTCWLPVVPVLGMAGIMGLQVYFNITTQQPQSLAWLINLGLALGVLQVYKPLCQSSPYFRGLYVLVMWEGVVTATSQLVTYTQQWVEVGSSLAWVSLALIGVVLLGVSLKLLQLKRWPFNENLTTHSIMLSGSILPLSGLLIVWSVLSVTSAGAMDGFSWIPLLNPLDVLTFGLGVVLWRLYLMLSTFNQSWAQVLKIVGLGLLFVQLNVLGLRVLHHWYGLAWEPSILSQAITQTSLAIVWSVCGLLLVWRGHKTASRMVWMLGGVLLGLVVLKLGLIDFRASGTLERVISFIGVGVLLLVVGFLAPLPPAKPAQEANHG